MFNCSTACRTAEDANLNQYWYSAHTISKVIEELELQCSKVAFLSTPSVFFSLKEDSPLLGGSKVFDLDEQWSGHASYVRYDFRHPGDVPAALHGAFDGVLIDPPFITREVWEQYAAAAKALLAQGGRVVCTTVVENAALMKDLFGAAPTPFKPSIPNLVYQYDLFCNFAPRVLCEPNPEVPE